MFKQGIKAYRVPRCRAITVSSILRATEGTANGFSPTARPLGTDQTIENNIQSDSNRLSKTLTKFWEKVDTKYNSELERYEIQLDGKTLKTPLGFPLSLPKEKKQLAYLIQHEWTNLPNLKIQTNSLPLTSIAARSIDLEATQNLGDEGSDLIAKVGKIEDIKLNLLRYFDTDTCLIFTTLDEYDGELRSKQNELYLPLIKEFEDFFTKYGQSKNLTKSAIKIKSLDCETDGLRGNQQDISTQTVVLDWLHNLTIYELVALEKAILMSKSFLCGLSLLRSNISDSQRQKTIFQINKDNADDYYFKTIDEIIELGNLETIFQTRLWGEVEDTHDVDKVDWIRNLTSAALLCH